MNIPGFSWNIEDRGWARSFSQTGSVHGGSRLSSMSSGVHDFVCHQGATRINSTCSSLTFLRTKGMRGNGGKAYAHIPDQGMARASMAYALSGLWEWRHACRNFVVVPCGKQINMWQAQCLGPLLPYGFRHLGVKRPLGAGYLGASAQPVRLYIKVTWNVPAL